MYACLWERITAAVHKHIDGEITSEVSQGQAHTSAGILGDPEAAKNNGRVSKNAHRMLSEQEFPDAFHTEL